MKISIMTLKEERTKEAARELRRKYLRYKDAEMFSYEP